MMRMERKKKVDTVLDEQPVTWQHLNPQKTCPPIYWHWLSVTTQMLHQQMTLCIFTHGAYDQSMFALNRYEYGLVRKPSRTAMVIMP
ncbi:hypothetical protein cypCar_00025759 [Cyprinus carpio]|nr:hypothetical protein cypCar_00025759 [Cyprinus carpio]